ncbi:MAG: glycosyltransferase [Phycisphaerales bacterium]|nr:glycosyltransferase [Phycisphaerales bacterium]
MLRILHITESCTARGGGTSTAFVEMVEALRTQPALCEVAACTQTIPHDDQVRTWIASHGPGTWLFTPPPGRVSTAGMFNALRAKIDSWSPSIVCIHGLWCTDVVAAAAHAQSRSIPVVWHPHGMLVHAALRRARLKKALFKALWLSHTLRRASACVFTSENERGTSNLSLLSPRTARVVLPLPVHIDTPESDLPALRAQGRAALGLADTAPLVSFIGRLHPVKRVDLSLAALAHAHALGTPAHLVLIGSGEEPYVNTLRAQAASLGIAKHLTFAGWKNGRDKLAILAAADAMILNSEFENFGYAIVESLALGTPVVASDNLSLGPDLARIGAGWCVSATAPILGAAINTALHTPPDRRRAMGRAGRRWVIDSFSRASVGTQMVALYRSLLA